MTDTNTDVKIYAKERYEKEKRTSKPISFNRVTESALIDITTNFKFGAWVKNILNHFTSAEVGFPKDDLNFIPASLVEHALENGYFDLDEYLKAKGKKIVDDGPTKTTSPYGHVPHEIDEFNQEYYN